MHDDDMPDYWGEICPSWFTLHHYKDDDCEKPELGYEDYVFKREVKIHAD